MIDLLICIRKYVRSTRSVITERLHIDVKYDVKIKIKKCTEYSLLISVL